MATMQAIRVHQYGGPEVMELEALPVPTAGPGQVVVQVGAAGVNFIDIYQRSGAYKLPLPLGLGLEGAGTILEVGDGVSSVAVGDRVAWTQIPGNTGSSRRTSASSGSPSPPSVSGMKP